MSSTPLSLNQAEKCALAQAAECAQSKCSTKLYSSLPRTREALKAQGSPMGECVLRVGKVLVDVAWLGWQHSLTASGPRSHSERCLRFGFTCPGEADPFNLPTNAPLPPLCQNTALVPAAPSHWATSSAAGHSPTATSPQPEDGTKGHGKEGTPSCFLPRT